MVIAIALLQTAIAIIVLSYRILGDRLQKFCLRSNIHQQAALRLRTPQQTEAVFEFTGAVFLFTGAVSLKTFMKLKQLLL
ncbi:hypothetical protein [uncultured Nostoc sp.]|uniref:hypothetical protein n=1 Tax=uncultured Nostoc sp. TaxID=340711 RepID=UPI002624C605|nr:hypothetical protein [uncultured Nostoc sp.]